MREAPPLAWAPQPGPQTAFVQCPLPDVCYGGARGGGKTDACLGEWMIHAERYGEDAKGIFLRRTLTALQPTISRAKKLFRGMARWSAGEKCFHWHNGAVLYFRYLDNDDDADNYQGHDYTRVYIEELTQFPDPRPVDKLRATLRSAAGVPTGFRASCNPGGPGHTWVKARYVDAGGFVVQRFTFEDPFTNRAIETSRVFIPARLSDNPMLLDNDPAYVANLYQAGSEQLVRAWLNGDWDIIEGAFFDCWKQEKHVVSPFRIPSHWTRIRSYDHGTSSPFSVGWWAVASETVKTSSGRIIPAGALVRYREWYGASGPNIGLKIHAEEIARGIKEREKGETIAVAVADTQIFADTGGPSISERMANEQVFWQPADKKRTRDSDVKLGGWDMMRARLVGEDGIPMLFVFSTCRDFIRTVPALQHDPHNAEDVHKKGEDHIGDEARYACMSRPWIAPPPKSAKKRDRWADNAEERDDWRTV